MIKKIKRVKKCGFTLVELITIIVILAIVLLIAIPQVMGVIKKSREDSYKNQLSSIINMADIYTSNNALEFDENNQKIITLEELIFKGISPEEIIDPRCDKPFNVEKTRVIVTKDGEGVLSSVIIPFTPCEESKGPNITSVNEVATYNSIKVNVLATDEIGIDKYYYAIDGGDYIESTATYTFTELDPQREYTIKVKVVNLSGIESVIEKKVTTLGDNPVVTLDNRFTYNSITVNTTATAGTGDISKYYYAIDNGEYIESELSTYTFNDLEVNQDYTIKVKVENTIGLFTEVIETVTTTTINPDITNITLTPTHNSIKVSTTATDPNGIAGYKYQVDDGEWTGLIPSSETTFDYIISNLSPMTGYTIKVMVVSVSGLEMISSPQFTTTEGSFPVIADFCNVAGASAISVCVDSSAGYGSITNYYFSKDNGATWIDNGLNSKYTFSNLASNSTYHIKVRVKNSINLEAESEMKEERTITPFTPSITPTALKYTPDGRLENGLLPIVHNGTNWEVADISREWYNYGAKQWANAISVSQDVRCKYTAGKVIEEKDVLAYFVYIPRYEYQLFNTGTKTVAPRTINVKFVTSSTPKKNGSTNGSWLTHPAFTFGSDELDGIWVGKFELGGTTTIPTIKPNQTSMRSKNLASFLSINQKFNDAKVYGISNLADTHTIKSTEWGAMVYLTRSIYGINTEVRVNNNKSFITGCGAASAPTAAYPSAPTTYSCEIPYGGTNQPQSTTGNVYGIYDTSGSSWEIVMAINDFGNSNNLDYSGFSTSLDSKYYNNYRYNTTQYGDATYAGRILGDALSETREWNDGYGVFMYNEFPWSVRGGAYFSGTYAGQTSFMQGKGYGVGDVSTRTVIPNFK